MDDIGERAHAAIVAADWNALLPLLHPYLHWTDTDGTTIRGRNRVLLCSPASAKAWAS